LTFNIVASRIANPEYQAFEVRRSVEFVAGIRFRQLTSKMYIDVLQRDYFLVGVTERANEFLLLLVMVYGWDFSAAYYEVCKVMNFKVTVEEFKQYFPDLVEKLVQQTEIARVGYEWAKAKFEENMKRHFGSSLEFNRTLIKFKKGLAQYQKMKLEQKPEPKARWRQVRYRDDMTEYC